MISETERGQEPAKQPLLTRRAEYSTGMKESTKVPYSTEEVRIENRGELPFPRDYQHIIARSYYIIFSEEHTYQVCIPVY